MAPTITETSYAWCVTAGKYAGQLIHPTLPSDAYYGISYTLWGDGDWPDLMPGDVIITTDKHVYTSGEPWGWVGVDFDNTDGTSGLHWRVYAAGDNVGDPLHYVWTFKKSGDYKSAWYWVIRNGHQTDPIYAYQKATMTASGRDAVLASWPTSTVTGPTGSTAVYLSMTWRWDYWAEEGWYSQSPAWDEQSDWDLPGVWVPRLGDAAYVDGEWRYGVYPFLTGWEDFYSAEGNPAVGGLDADEFVGHRVHRGYAGGSVADDDLPRILVVKVQP